METLLAEEREKVQSFAKKLKKSNGLQTKYADESKMFEKERGIAKQEVRLDSLTSYQSYRKW